MRSFLVLLAVLATASAFSFFDSNPSHGNYSDFELIEKACNCKNGQCVTDNRGKTKCNCKAGYALQDEETCEECDCGENGQCFFSLRLIFNGEATYEKKCLCDDNYAAKDGYCAECVCGENNKCEFEDGEKNCYCIEGYSEKDGVCTECNCGENGECKFENGEKICYCDEDYLVNNGICEECYCGDNGTCSFQNEVKTCACDTGFKEKEGICEVCNCGQFEVDCRYEKEEKICQCRDRYAQKLGICEVCDCGDFGIGCRYEKEEKICQCRDGYAEKQGVCEECECGDNSLGCTFSNDQEKLCECENGYVQRGDKCEVGCGVYRHCENAGLCDNGYCTCMIGTSGRFCEVVDDCRFLCPNTKDIACVYNALHQRAYCKCLKEKHSFDPLTQKCRIGCGLYQACKNGGLCDNGYCTCMIGTSGRFCEVVDDCRYLCPNMKNITCAYDVLRQKAHCKCPQEELRFDFRTHECRNTCDQVPCNNGGTCDKSDEFGFCRCIAGTGGDHCKIDAGNLIADATHTSYRCYTYICDEDGCKYHDVCGEGATCDFDVEKGTGYCACNDKRLSYDERTGKCKIDWH